MSEIVPAIAREDEVLGRRFAHLWDRCLVPGAWSDPVVVWANLAKLYAAPGRRYHNLHHLAQCLAEFDRVRAQLRDPDQVEMALWFHDAIYVPGAADNEARSAALFSATAGTLMPLDFVAAVSALILVTTHDGEPSDPDQRALCDIDMSGFALPWGQFLRDSVNLKDEAPGSEEDYYRTKTAFLEALMARPRIYFTEFFFERLEAEARRNIGQFLRMLERREVRDAVEHEG